ncbi:MAG: DUF6765 family protein [Promethearchaeota archaeon]
MQIDFHFGMIYVLSRSVGFDANISEQIAWASQFVDDCKEDIKIVDENGNEIEHIVTSYDAIHPNNFVFEEGFEVWIPFHFLPGGEGNSLPERLVCKKASENLNATIILAHYRENGFNPIYLGIILHVIGDTFSHQDFNGMLSNQNDIDDVKPLLENEEYEDKKKIIEQIKTFLSMLTSRVVTHIFRVGHAEANIRPDIPYMQWSYKKENEVISSINNLERVEEGLKFIYDILIEEAGNNGYSNPALSKEEAVEKIIELIKIFKIEDTQKRFNQWMSAINGKLLNDYIPEDNVEYKGKNVSKERLLEFHKFATEHQKCVHEFVLKPILEKGYRNIEEK